MHQIDPEGNHSFSDLMLIIIIEPERERRFGFDVFSCDLQMRRI